MNKTQEAVSAEDTQVVQNLVDVWDNVRALCAPLTEAQWKQPSDLPGWTVQDVVSHLVDLEQFFMGDPRPEHKASDGAEHVRNDFGQYMEHGVDYRRGKTGAEVFAEYEDIADRRTAHLRGLASDDFENEVTMVMGGKGPLRDLLAFRIFDLWVHEQDLRRALKQPGGTDNAAAKYVLDSLTGRMGFVVGKKAAAPDGIYRFEVGGYRNFDVVVAQGRGAVADINNEAPTFTLRMDVHNYTKALCGRDEKPTFDVEPNQRDLAEKIIGEMNLMP